MTFKILLNPSRVYSATAIEGILPGYFVKASSNFDIAITESWSNDLFVMKCDATGDDVLCVGLAIGSAVSGAVVSVATDGIYSLLGASTITAGQEIGAPVSDPLSVRAASYTCTGSTNALQYIKPLGQALGTSASGEQATFLLSI
jgi:hypothetical protein